MLSIRVSTEMWDKLSIEAEKTKQSMSEILNSILEDYFKQRASIDDVAGWIKSKIENIPEGMEFTLADLFKGESYRGFTDSEVKRLYNAISEQAEKLNITLKWPDRNCRHSIFIKN